MKKVLVVLFSVLIALSLVAPVCAGASKVTYSGNSGKFIFSPGSTYSPTDLFTELKDIMPGDTVYQDVTIGNNADKTVKVKIYLRALGADATSKEFLSQLKLTVVSNSNNVVFKANADETAGLTDWVCLGTLYSGGEATLRVRLDIPLILDNNNQNLVGMLDWEFKAEEFPVSDEEDNPITPFTGDSMNLLVIVGLAVVSICIIVVLAIILAKHKKSNK